MDSSLVLPFKPWAFTVVRVIPIMSSSPRDGVQLFSTELAFLNVLLLGCPDVDLYGPLPALDGKMVGMIFERIGRHEGRHAQIMPTFSSTIVQSEERTSSGWVGQRLSIMLKRNALDLHVGSELVDEKLRVCIRKMLVIITLLGIVS